MTVMPTTQRRPIASGARATASGRKDKWGEQVLPAPSLSPTLLYEAELGDEALLADLAHPIRTLARDDAAGIGWSRDKAYAGYTSYASLDDLPRRDPAFADLARVLARHAPAFATAAAFPPATPDP